MKILFCLTALLFSLSLFGCKKETRLSGQIFIVTRGAESIKLGLVDVRLIEKQQAVDFLKKKQPEIDAQMLTLSSQFAKLAEKSQSDYTALQTSLSESQSTEEKATIAKAMIRNTDALKETLAAFKSLPSEAMYFEMFSPDTLQKTTTDADGKFQFTYPSNRSFIIFAKAKRMVGDETENYYWLVNIPSDAGDSRILLSNNNLVFSDPEGFFKKSPQQEKQMQSTP
jgi:hypothetical protein